MDYFTYSPKEDKWKECFDEKLTKAVDIPIVIIEKYFCERTGESWEKVWCDEHKAYEDIEILEDNGVITKNGCHLTGLVVRTKMNEYQTYYGYGAPSSKRAVRYRLIHRTEEKSVHIVKEEITVFYEQEKNENGKFIHYPGAILRKNNVEVYSLLKKKQPDFMSRYPFEAMSKKIMLVLKEDAEKIYGTKILSPIFSEKRINENYRDEVIGEYLIAFLNRPLDMNIWFFRKYFGDEWEELFPKTQAENFTILANKFNMKPTEELRKAYEENPASIIFNLMLPQLGISDIKEIKNFYRLTSFFGKTMKKAFSKKPFFNPLNINAQNSIEYESLKFYCLWRREKESESELSDCLLKEQENWRWYKFEALMAFKKYFDKIPEELKAEILKYGIRFDIYNKIMVLKEHFEKNIIDLPYDEADVLRECKVNDYNFRLAHSKKFYNEIMRTYSFMVNAEEETDKYVVYIVERNSRTLATIIIEKKGEKIVAKRSDIRDDRDSILWLKCHAAMFAWYLHNGIEAKRYSSLKDYKDIMDQEFIIEPVDKNEEWENLSLMEMLEVPKEKISAGYYLYLYKKLIKASLIKIEPPSAKEDEKEYLYKKFYWAKPIYDAVWNKNPNAEAEYVMSLMYRDGNVILTDHRLADEWYKKAKANGFKQIESAKKDVKINEFPITTTKTGISYTTIYA